LGVKIFRVGAETDRVTTHSSTSKQTGPAKTAEKTATRKVAVKRATKKTAAKPAVAAALPRQRANKKPAPAARKPAVAKSVAAKSTAAKSTAAKPVGAKPVGPKPRKTAPARTPRPLIDLARRKDGRAMSFTERLSEKRHAQFDHAGPVCHSCRMHASQLAAAAAAATASRVVAV
jgi:hypothetical protein